MKKIGIECESIENDTWGVARMINKLLEEIDRRPELKNEFEFYLYFKSKIPDYPYLQNPIFKKTIIKPPIIPSSFSLYYYVYLPIYLWFKRVHTMFFPNYMLPLIFLGKSVVMLTDDIYYESRNPKLPFRYRLAYRIFAGWAARHASQIIAISENSKKELVRLFKIRPERIVVNHLGIDFRMIQDSRFKIQDPYLLYVGQAFPRRHLKETISAYRMLSKEFPDLKLVAIGPDKYPEPLDFTGVIHKDYVEDAELVSLYAGAKALVYVSDREAFGLPPMEALLFGVPPVIADNELGRELFEDYAFYVRNPDSDSIAKSIRDALIQTEKIAKIKTEGPKFVKKYSWKSFTDKFLSFI